MPALRKEGNMFNEMLDQRKKMNKLVLKLNANFMPIEVCSVEDAVRLMSKGCINIVESYDEIIRSPSIELRIPSVISLREFAPISLEVTLSRRAIFTRDKYICQYCGERLPPTIDHVVPKDQGGPYTWENLTTACFDCNHVKANRTPAQANMPLLSLPAKPSRYSQFSRYVTPEREMWKPYLFLSA
jgi:5-methylcytosine-specific restriction endonuclease McrA